MASVNPEPLLQTYLAMRNALKAAEGRAKAASSALSAAAAANKAAEQAKGGSDIKTTTALLKAQKANTAAQTELSTAKTRMDSAERALVENGIAVPGPAPPTAAPRGADVDAIRQRYQQEINPTVDEVEFANYYYPFRKSFPNQPLVPVYAQYKARKDEDERERVEMLASSNPKGQVEAQKLYEWRYGKYNALRDQLLAGWLARNPGKSIVDAMNDLANQVALEKLMGKVKSSADARASNLSAKKNRTPEEEEELRALSNARSGLQEGMVREAQRRESAGADPRQQLADQAHQERLQQLTKAKAEAVREQVLEQVGSETLYGLSYDAARREDEKWLRETHQPTQAEEDEWSKYATQTIPPHKWRAAVPFTTGQRSMLFRTRQEIEADAAPKPATAGRQSADREWYMDAAAVGTSAAQLAERSAVLGRQPLLFNTNFAVRLLREHLTSLEKLITEQPSDDARFTDVAHALGKDLDEAAKQLLPTFQALCEYRNTMLWVKRFQLEQSRSLQLVADKKTAEAEARALEQLEMLTSDDPQWKVYARRLMDAEEGRLPGQLYFPQPFYLPLRIAAPPRVGKSACGLLVASLARRLGMKVLYSVSPNKLQPIKEMQQKLISIGWFEENRQVVLGGDHSLELKFYSIERIPGDKCRPAAEAVDFVLYSSDVLPDCQRAGALLAGWMRTPQVVLHMRDEAQSLAKAIGNETVPCHKEGAPPRQELQYLRAFYGNYYGLNLNITATHFPTLLEEPLWGFIGSVRQLVQADVPAASWRDPRAIDRLLGAEFLPSLVTALQPAVPDSYMGVERLRAWRPDGARTDATLPRGTKSAQQASKSVARQGSDDEYDPSPPRPPPRRDDNGIEALSDAEREYRLQLGRLTPAQLRVREVVDDPASKMERYIASEKDAEGKDVAEAGATRRARLARNRARYLELAGGKQDEEAEAQLVGRQFQEWLVEEERDIGWWRSPKQRSENAIMVPTLISALNSRIDNAGMASFLRLYAQIAHRVSLSSTLEQARLASDLLAGRDPQAEAPAAAAGKSKQPKKKKKKDGASAAADTRDPMDRATGVAFLFFNDVIKDGASLKSSKLEASNELIGDGKRVPPLSEGASGLLLAVYRYTDNHDVAAGEVPRFEMLLASGAKEAVRHAWEAYRISRVAVLGYGMLKAGLTVQVFLPARGGEPERHYCPRYLAMSTSSSTPLDTQLQMAGRTFVDLKEHEAPFDWKIEVLGVPGIVETLAQYSNMEQQLANLKPTRIYRALRESFGTKFIKPNELGSMGTVGAREGDFAAMLGLTFEAAKKELAAQAAAGPSGAAVPTPAPVTAPLGFHRGMHISMLTDADEQQAAKRRRELPPLSLLERGVQEGGTCAMAGPLVAFRMSPLWVDLVTGPLKRRPDASTIIFALMCDAYTSSELLGGTCTELDIPMVHDMVFAIQDGLLGRSDPESKDLSPYEQYLDRLTAVAAEEEWDSFPPLGETQETWGDRLEDALATMIRVQEPFTGNDSNAWFRWIERHVDGYATARGWKYDDTAWGQRRMYALKAWLAQAPMLAWPDGSMHATDPRTYPQKFEGALELLGDVDLDWAEQVTNRGLDPVDNGAYAMLDFVDGVLMQIGSNPTDARLQVWKRELEQFRARMVDPTKPATGTPRPPKPSPLTATPPAWARDPSSPTSWKTDPDLVPRLEAIADGWRDAPSLSRPGPLLTDHALRNDGFYTRSDPLEEGGALAQRRDAITKLTESYFTATRLASSKPVNTRTIAGEMAGHQIASAIAMLPHVQLRMLYSYDPVIQGPTKVPRFVAYNEFTNPVEGVGHRKGSEIADARDSDEARARIYRTLCGPVPNVRGRPGGDLPARYGRAWHPLALRG